MAAAAAGLDEEEEEEETGSGTFGRDFEANFNAFRFFDLKSSGVLRRLPLDAISTRDVKECAFWLEGGLSVMKKLTVEQCSD